MTGYKVGVTGVQGGVEETGLEKCLALMCLSSSTWFSEGWRGWYFPQSSSKVCQENEMMQKSFQNV